MRVVFVGALPPNTIVFEAVVQNFPGCVGVICSDLTLAWEACLEGSPDLLLV